MPSSLASCGSHLFQMVYQVRWISWRDVEDPVRVERYQAEALVHRHVPVVAISGMVCHSAAIRRKIEADAAATVATTGLKLDLRALPSWYF